MDRDRPCVAKVSEDLGGITKYSTIGKPDAGTWKESPPWSPNGNEKSYPCSLVAVLHRAGHDHVSYSPRNTVERRTDISDLSTRVSEGIRNDETMILMEIYHFQRYWRTISDLRQKKESNASLLFMALP